MRKTLGALAMAVAVVAGCRNAGKSGADAGQAAATDASIPSAEYWDAAERQNAAVEKAAAECKAGISIPDSAAVGRGLQLIALPVRAVVPVEGSMEVAFSLCNHSDSMVIFRPVFNFGAWLDADIVDSAGTPLEKTAAIDPPNALETLIRPRSSLAEVVDLRCSVPRAPCVAPYDGLSRPGVYEVRMHFTLPCDTACNKRVTVVAKPFTVRVERIPKRIRR